MGENRKLFWKEVSRINRRNVEGYSRIKDGNGRLALGEDEARRIWKDWFDNIIFIIWITRSRL